MSITTRKRNHSSPTGKSDRKYWNWTFWMTGCTQIYSSTIWAVIHGKPSTTAPLCTSQHGQLWLPTRALSSQLVPQAGGGLLSCGLASCWCSQFPRIHDPCRRGTESGDGVVSACCEVGPFECDSIFWACLIPWYIFIFHFSAGIFLSRWSSCLACFG